MKVAAVCLVLIVLWFLVFQYFVRIERCSKVTDERGLLPSRDKQGAGSLSKLLTAALADGNPIIHLITTKACKPTFSMFVCSNCNCDICEKIRSLGYWSPVETIIFHYILGNGRCSDGEALVVDGGAHVGYFSLIAAAYGCRVAAFEPNLKAIRYLQASVALHELGSLVTLYPKAPGSTRASALYTEPGTWALNFIRRRHLGEVEVIQLDTVVDGEIILMKIDTEGYEEEVIHGAHTLLSDHKVENVLVEVKLVSKLQWKRDLLRNLLVVGNFSYVYNYQEIEDQLTIPLEQFQLPNTTILDVTSTIYDKLFYAELHQDYWFRKERLPWL